MASAPTYGAYPHLFWDLDPAAPVNVRHAVVLRRVLERGSTADISELVDPAGALASLASLGLPEYLVQFWRSVFERAVDTRR